MLESPLRDLILKPLLFYCRHQNRSDKRSPSRAAYLSHLDGASFLLESELIKISAIKARGHSSASKKRSAIILRRKKTDLNGRRLNISDFIQRSHKKWISLAVLLSTLSNHSVACVSSVVSNCHREEFSFVIAQMELHGSEPWLEPKVLRSFFFCQRATLPFHLS